MASMNQTREIATNILVFKTDISTDEDVSNVALLMRKEMRIKKWTVDRNDIDNVLRIEACNIGVEEVTLLVKQSGFNCEELED